MNTTFNNTASNIWKRLKLQHISLVCGLTVATVVAVTGGAWHSDAAETSPRAAVRPASPGLHLTLARLQREAVEAARDAVDLGAEQDIVGVLIAPNGAAERQPGDMPAGSAALVPVSSARHAPSPKAPVIYVVTDGQETPYQLLLAAAEMQNPHVEVRVVPLESPEAEQAFAQTLLDRALLRDAGMHIVDLRGR